MNLRQRSGLASFLIGLTLMVMMGTEVMIKGFTTGNFWLAVIFVLIGVILFLIGE